MTPDHLIAVEPETTAEPRPSRELELLERLAVAVEALTEAINRQPLPAQESAPEPEPDESKRGGHLLTFNEVAHLYGISPELLGLRHRNGQIKAEKGYNGMLSLREESLPPLPEGPLVTPELARAITGLTNAGLLEAARRGEITAYRPFDIKQNRYARQSLVNLSYRRGNA